jgi:hypothetical protein
MVENEQKILYYMKNKISGAVAAKMAIQLFDKIYK